MPRLVFCLLSLLLQLLPPSASFLPNSDYAFQFYSGTSSPPLVFPMALSENQDDEEFLPSFDESPTFLQAKLDILQDVVIQLNLTRTSLEAELEDKEEHVKTLTKQHQQELDILRSQSLQEIDKLKEELRGEKAAVAAAEAREEALQIKLDDLEARYHGEAAEYKIELTALQKEWKLANRQLEKEVERLTTELTESKRIRDKETTSLLDSLTARSAQLEGELNTAREQIQFQKLQFATQKQVAREEWKEQMEKERKVYTEAIKLLQRERAVKPSIWKRLLRSIFGARKETKAGTTRNGSRLWP